MSASWETVFSWDGTGQMPAAELEKLRGIVKKAHDQGKKVRFWALPPTEAVWSTLYNEGVDFINADNHADVRDFLLKQK